MSGNPGSPGGSTYAASVYPGGLIRPPEALLRTRRATLQNYEAGEWVLYWHCEEDLQRAPPSQEMTYRVASSASGAVAVACHVRQ